MKKILKLLILIPLLTGCTYTELEDLAIASAISIDYDNQFILTAQVMDVKTNSAGTLEEKSIIYQGKGQTISEAVRNFSIKYPKNIYFGHLEVLVLSKTIIENHLNEVLDYFFKSPETRTSGYILVKEEGNAETILNPENGKIDTFPAEDIKSILTDSSKRTGTVKDITLEEFTQDYLKKDFSPLVPLIDVQKTKGMTSSKLILENMAVLKNGKKLIKLDKKSSIAYNTIKQNYTDITINAKYKNMELAPIIYYPKSKITLKIKNNQITINIKIKAEAIISNSNGIDQTNQKMHKKLEKAIENSLETYINTLINFSEKNNADILGIKNMIYKNYNKNYKKPNYTKNTCFFLILNYRKSCWY